MQYYFQNLTNQTLIVHMPLSVSLDNLGICTNS